MHRSREQADAEIETRIETMTTGELRVAFLFSGGSPANLWANALAVALNMREGEAISSDDVDRRQSEQS